MSIRNQVRSDIDKNYFYTNVIKSDKNNTIIIIRPDPIESLTPLP
jgi:hypothetical protein